jgi:tetratricopeptide (TPR) repeat protein
MDHDERSLGSELRSATDLELAGRLEEAAAIYQQLAEDHPASWKVRQRYARLSWNRQRREQAFALLDEALAIAPEQSALHAERADYLFAMGHLEAAQASMQEASRLAPEEADHHVKLALVRLESRDIQGAWTAAQRAIELDPDHKGARQILGDLCWQRGELENAVEHFTISRRPPNSAADPNGGFSSTLFALGRAPEIATLSKPNINAQDYIETVLRGTFNWQNGRLERCKKLMSKAEALYSRTPNAPRVPIFHQIQRVVGTMTDFLPNNPEFYQTEAEAPLFLVGDNHVLPAAHLTLPFDGQRRRAIGILVVSMKITSLIPEAAENPQRTGLLAALDRLPAGADVMLSAGELDTRYGDGILGRLKANSSLDRDKTVGQLVADYLDTTADWCRERDLRPAYLIQPAPNVKLRQIPSFDREPFLGLIRIFVDSLRREAAARNLPVVDLYAVTANGDGRGRRELFIDSNHALPQAYRTAFENASQ